MVPTQTVRQTSRTAALIFGVLLCRRTLRRHDGWSVQQLHAYQDRALDRLRRHAYRRSSFYRQFHAGALDRPLRELPVLTKSTLMENFDDIVTVPGVHLPELDHYLTTLTGDELFRGKYYVSATAGTTGRRGIFLWDFAEWVHVICSYNRAFDWAGSTVGLTHRVKAALVSSTNLSHQSARVGSSIHSRWVPTLRLDSGDPLPHLVARLNEWQPEMLIGYASMVRLLAEEQLAGRLTIAPRFVFSASEVLLESTRTLATTAWRTRICDVYGATEASGIAAECGHHRGMHLFDDLVVTEIVDENNQPVPPEVHGAKLLVTVLFSRTLPLIRYELTDSVERAARHDCGCGRPYALISGIQGRQQEALQLPTADGRLVTVQPIVFHHVMDKVEAAGWQVVRHPDLLEVLLAQPHDVAAAQLEEDVRQALTSRGAAPPRVHVREVDAIPRTALGKAPLIMTANR